MRDPNRLYGFYDHVREIHMTKFPDWRFGQLMTNFIGYVATRHGVDVFFLEEDKLLEYFEEFSGRKVK